MAKTNNNKRPKKRRLDKSSSDQKENKPKKVKVNKPNPNDTIAMSRQLVMKKKTARNSTRGKRQCKTNNRVCGNKKIMPSLSDLEKMFEDSDEDSDQNVRNNNNNNEVLEVPDTLQDELPTSINPDLIFSPTTRTAIKEQVIEILSNIDNSNICQDNISTQPPKKRLKLSSCESDHIQVCDLTNIATANQDAIISTEEEPNIQVSDNELKSCQENMTSSLIDNGNASDTSSESNNTIEYKLDACNMVQAGSISQRFSPLPSTSTNNQIFIKNDELFHRSLQQASVINRQLEDKKMEATEMLTEDMLMDDETKEKQDENNLNDSAPIKNEEQLDTAPMLKNDKQAENEETDLQIIEIPTETILILDDDIKNEAFEDNNKIETINDIEALDSNNQSVEIHDDDDDCIFVETQKEPRKPTPTVTDIIDLEYDFVEPSINIDAITNVDDDEIIDVDALIAQNQTILEQYNKPESKKLSSTSLVVDVDVSAITENSNNNTNISINDQVSEILPEESKIAPNVQNPAASTTDAVPSTSRNNQRAHNIQSEMTRRARKRQNRHPSNSNEANSNHHNQDSSYNRNIIQTHVQDFFRNYRPPDNRIRGDTHSHFDMNLGDVLRSAYTVLSDRYWPNDFNRPAPGHRNANYTSSFERYSSSSSSSQRYSTSSSSSHRYIAPSLSPQRHNTCTTSPRRTLKPPRRRNNSSQSTSCSALNQQTRNTDAVQQGTSPLKTNNETAVIEDETPPTQEKSGILGDCPICMERLSGKVIASTICGHVFCMRCLQQAIATNKRCPTCRKILKKNGYHQIFL